MTDLEDLKLTPKQHEFMMSKKDHVSYTTIGKRHVVARHLEAKGLVRNVQGLFSHFTDSGLAYIAAHRRMEQGGVRGE